MFFLQFSNFSNFSLSSYCFDQSDIIIIVIKCYYHSLENIDIGIPNTKPEKSGVRTEVNLMKNDISWKLEPQGRIQVVFGCAHSAKALTSVCSKQHCLHSLNFGEKQLQILLGYFKPFQATYIVWSPIIQEPNVSRNSQAQRFVKLSKL